MSILLSIWLAEGLNGHTAEETKGKHVSDLGIMQLPNKLKIEDSSTVLDSNEYHLTSDCPEQPQAHHVHFFLIVSVFHIYSPRWPFTTPKSCSSSTYPLRAHACFFPPPPPLLSRPPLYSQGWISLNVLCNMSCVVFFFCFVFTTWN